MLKGRNKQQLYGNKKSYRTVLFTITMTMMAGLAVASSGCSASPQIEIQVPAAYNSAAPEVEQPAGEIAPKAAQQEAAVQQQMAAEAIAVDERSASSGAEAAPSYQAQALETNQSQPANPEDSIPEVQPTAFLIETPLPTSQPEQPTENSAVQAAPQAEALPSAEPKVGFLAPDISLSTLDGSVVRLADLRGKNVLINYWVTWCIPCMNELPVLSQLSQVYQDQNVVILTVNGIEQDQMGAVQQVVADLGLKQPVLLDESQSFWSTYLVQFLPTSFFIDTQGIIRHIMLGSATEDALRSKLDMLILNQL